MQTKVLVKVIDEYVTEIYSTDPSIQIFVQDTNIADNRKYEFTIIPVTIEEFEKLL